MTNPHHISRKAFIRTFPHLVTGRSFLPKKRSELQMLLTSVTFRFEFQRIYTEKEVNELILEWVARFGDPLGIDHVTLRRYLVDEGLLARDEFGSTYRLSEASPYFTYEPTIRDLDLEDLVVRAGEEREARKRAFLDAEEKDASDDEKH